MVTEYHNLNAFNPFPNFRQAAEAVLQGLYDRLPFKLWMVTHTEGEDWSVLATVDHGYEVKAGDVFCWSDSICYRMTQGLGPYLANRSEDIPAYASAPIRKKIKIGAYIGIPLIHKNGSLYGTLCAIHPAEFGHTLNDEFEFIKTQARLLSTLISCEEQKEVIKGELKTEKQVSQLDALTGVYNRRGWNNILIIEEQRCQRYDSPASIIMLDLDDLKRVNDNYGHKFGDELLKRTAGLLVNAVRSFDLVCRIGGDEFAILGVELTEVETEQMVERIQARLQEEEIAASIGWASRMPSMELTEVLERADRHMYREKGTHRH